MQGDAITFKSKRPDGRFVTIEGTLHARRMNLDQKLTFSSDMSRGEFEAWRKQVRTKLRECKGGSTTPT